MKKIILTFAALVLATAAFAQDREIDLEDFENFNKVELSRGKTHVETNLSFAFPMYFGWNVLTNINYKGAWTGGDSAPFLNFNAGRSFTYGLQLVDMNIRYGAFAFSVGLRWTFMDFVFENPGITLRQVNNTYLPATITDAGYNGKKSKLHTTYFGVPARLSLNFGKATIYAGGSIEYLVNGFAKYKQPKVKTQMKPAFNNIRATVEGGFSYGNLGIFAIYGLTPLFPAELSDARTLTIGLILGL